MFNIGGGEVLVIALIALIVLGPERLPTAARQVGKVMGDLRKMSTGFQNEIKGAFNEVDLQSRSSDRRNVLSSSPAVSASAASPTEVTTAIGAVSDQAPAPAAAKKPAAKKAPATKTPAKRPAAKKAAVKKAAVKKAPAKKAVAKKPASKKAAATKTTT